MQLPLLVFAKYTRYRPEWLMPTGLLKLRPSLLLAKSQLKYEYVVAALTPEFVTEVWDLILTYGQLKASLIKRTAASEQRRLQQLFHSEELEDRKPSQLLCHLQQLFGDYQAGISPPFLFLEKCSPNVFQAMCACSWPPPQTICPLKNRPHHGHVTFNSGRTHLNILA